MPDSGSASRCQNRLAGALSATCLATHGIGMHGATVVKCASLMLLDMADLGTPPYTAACQLACTPCSLDVQLSQLEASLAAADAPTLELLGQSTSRWMHATGQTTAAGVNQPPGVQPDEPATSCDDVQDVSSSSKPTSVDAPDGQHLNSSTPTQATSSSIDTTGPSPDPSSSIQLSSSKQDRANSKEAADMQEAAAPVPGSSTAGAEVNSVVPEVAASGAEGDSSGP